MAHEHHDYIPTNIPDSGPSDGAAADGTGADVQEKERTPSPERGGHYDHPHSAHHKREEWARGKRELKEWECYDKTGFSFPWWKKWGILTVIFMVQVSMNFNASFYAGSISLLSKRFGVSEQAARVGQCVFLVAYGFGCEFWAPWSEEYGRWPVLQLSLFLVNIWQLPAALAPNIGTIIIARVLGGLSSAGGSVTLGMVADMWEADDQQFAVNYIVLSSVAGSVVAPIVGGFVTKFLDWHWNFWLQLILGGFVQILHFCLVPETRCSILVTREARRRRKQGDMVYSPDELKGKRLNFVHFAKIWARPYLMFVREPIVLWLSLLSGFSDSLIFTFLQSYQPVYKQWGFQTIGIGLAFIPLMVGYFIAYFSFFPTIYHQRKIRRKDPDALQPEARLWWLLWTVPLEPIGLFGFAWTSLGPPRVHWIAPMIFSTLIAIANFAIYMATIDYMVAAYGPYSASATGGNGFARDFLAGVAAMYSVPMYENMGRALHLEWPTLLLAILAVFIVSPVYIFYWKGPVIREKSRFAQVLEADRKKTRRKLTQQQCGTGVTGPEERYLEQDV